MNITVIGAGEVGTHIAAVLSREKHNVVVIDNDQGRLRDVEDALDVQTLLGHGTDVTVLERAGVTKSDLVLAVSSSDEVNFVSARVAKALGARQTIVRARKPFYLEERLQAYAEAFGVDRVVCPEVLTAQEIAKRFEHPGTLKLEYFAHGRIQMRNVIVEEGTKGAGRKLKDIPFPGRTLIASISRGDQVLIPGGDDSVQPGDMITILGSTVDISRIQALFRRRAERVRRVVIVGGGLVGLYLAQILERRNFSVTLIERRREQCAVLSQQLGRTEVVHGDATMLQFLKEHRFAQADAFAAATNIDETNLMSALLMRELGVPLLAVLMHRPDFASLVERLGITYALSPRFVVANTVLNMLQQKNVLSVSFLDRGASEVMEFRAAQGSPMVGRVLKDARLPRNSLIAAIVRRGEVIVPKGDDHIEAGDTVIAFALHESAQRLQRLFQE